MADATTTNQGYTQPEVGGSQDTWGAKLNTNWSDLDSYLGAVADKWVPKSGGTFTGAVTFSAAVTMAAALDLNAAADIQGLLTLQAGLTDTGGDVATVGNLISRAAAAQGVRLEGAATVALRGLSTAGAAGDLILSAALDTSGLLTGPVQVYETGGSVIAKFIDDTATMSDVDEVVTQVKGDARYLGIAATPAAHTHDADEVNIADAGGYFTGTEVETALQEVGASLGKTAVLGYVNASGVKQWGSGFSSSQLGTGEYRITFDTANGDEYAVAAIVEAGGQMRSASIDNVLAARFDLHIHNASNAHVNLPFRFMVRYL